MVAEKVFRLAQGTEFQRCRRGASRFNRGLLSGLLDSSRAKIAFKPLDDALVEIALVIHLARHVALSGIDDQLAGDAKMAETAEQLD